ncbi:plasma membrane ascorbate-dependent reductase CYBRD1 isoform X1 [Tamandua tetradactyla]|uniref:plasma membrane ascorbate-dependent reductase CYBRD1 isoform X1 n=1 Tax=Tamandua tetradactyla TaxID=48850 RepID=UPI004053ED89
MERSRKGFRESCLSPGTSRLLSEQAAFSPIFHSPQANKVPTYSEKKPYFLFICFGLNHLLQPSASVASSPTTGWGERRYSCSASVPRLPGYGWGLASRPIIVYRLPWTWKCSKLLMKSIHAGLNAVAAILAIISLVAVFDFHNAKYIPNMYSLHSWVGLTAVIFYVLQLLLGFFIFLLPLAPLSLRAIVMPIHVYSGLLIFGTVIATALMGLTEKLFFTLKDPAYSTFPPEGIFTNTLGLLILVFGALIFWIVTRPQWKRPKEPNSILLQPNGGTPEGGEGSMAINFGSNMEKSDLELDSEVAARKRNFTLDEAGQRSTM